MMLGNNLWSENRRGDLVPPKAVISISGEPSPLESLTEWSTPMGKNFDINDPPLAARESGSTTFMGRCIGKQLFISDVDERKKKVEALVRVVIPADEAEGEPEKLLGVFQSRPIKVISKPSKKRQSAKNLECKHILRASLDNYQPLCFAQYASIMGRQCPSSIVFARKLSPPSTFVSLVLPQHTRDPMVSLFQV